MGSCITKDNTYEPEPLIVKNQEQVYGFLQEKPSYKPKFRADPVPRYCYTQDISTLPSYLTLENQLNELEKSLTLKKQLSKRLEQQYGTIGTLDAVKQRRRRRRAQRFEIHHTPYFTYSDH